MDIHRIASVHAREYHRGPTRCIARPDVIASIEQVISDAAALSQGDIRLAVELGLVSADTVRPLGFNDPLFYAPTDAEMAPVAGAPSLGCFDAAFAYRKQGRGRPPPQPSPAARGRATQRAGSCSCRGRSRPSSSRSRRGCARAAMRCTGSTSVSAT